MVQPLEKIGGICLSFIHVGFISIAMHGYGHYCSFFVVNILMMLMLGCVVMNAFSLLCAYYMKEFKMSSLGG